MTHNTSAGPVPDDACNDQAFYGMIYSKSNR